MHSRTLKDVPISDCICTLVTCAGLNKQMLCNIVPRVVVQHLFVYASGCASTFRISPSDKVRQTWNTWFTQAYSDRGRRLSFMERLLDWRAFHISWIGSFSCMVEPCCSCAVRYRCLFCRVCRRRSFQAHWFELSFSHTSFVVACLVAYVAVALDCQQL